MKRPGRRANAPVGRRDHGVARMHGQDLAVARLDDTRAFGDSHALGQGVGVRGGTGAGREPYGAHPKR
jgi:hypothetical protein